MILASTFRSLRGRRLRDEDGHEHVLELLPPAHVWALIPPERKPGLWQRLFKGGQ